MALFSIGRVLREIERFAALFKPMPEGGFTEHHPIQSEGVRRVYEFLYDLSYDTSPFMSNDDLV
jgi:hypothetical protein